MISSASPTELQRFATTEAARAAELDHQAQRLGAALGHFAATCTEFSTGIDSSLAHPLHDHARSASAIGERTAAVGRQFERADQGAGFRTTLRTLVQVFHGLALRMATGSGGRVSSGNLNPLLQPFRNLALQAATSPRPDHVSISLLAWAPAFALIGGTVTLFTNLWQAIQNSWNDWRQWFSAWWNNWNQGVADWWQNAQNSWNDWWQNAQNSWNNWWQNAQNSWNDWWQATQRSWDEWWQNTGDWWNSWWQPGEWWNGIVNWWNDLHPFWKGVLIVLGILIAIILALVAVKLALAAGAGALLAAIGSFLKGAVVFVFTRALPWIVRQGLPWVWRWISQQAWPWVWRWISQQAWPWVSKQAWPWVWKNLSIDFTKGVINAIGRILVNLFKLYNVYSTGEMLIDFGRTVLTYMFAGRASSTATGEQFKNLLSAYDKWVTTNVPPQFQGLARVGGPIAAGLFLLFGGLLVKRIPIGGLLKRLPPLPPWTANLGTYLWTMTPPGVPYLLNAARSLPGAILNRLPPSWAAKLKYLKENLIQAWKAEWKSNLLKLRINTFWSWFLSQDPFQAALTALGYIFSGGFSAKNRETIISAIRWTAAGEFVKILPVTIYRVVKQLSSPPATPPSNSQPSNSPTAPATPPASNSPTGTGVGHIPATTSVNNGANNGVGSGSSATPFIPHTPNVPEPTRIEAPSSSNGDGTSSIPDAPATPVDPTLMPEPTPIQAPSPSDGNGVSDAAPEIPSVQPDLPDPDVIEDAVARLREQLRQGTPVESLLAGGAAVRDLLAAGVLPETLLLVRPTEAMLHELVALAQTDAQVAPILQRFLGLASDQRAEGRVTLEAALQAAIGLELEKSGQLTGPLAPAYMPDGRRVLVDGNNVAWGFMPALDSPQPGEHAEATFDLPALMSRLMALQETGLHVILTTDDLTPPQLAEVQAAIATLPFADRVLLWNPTTSPVPAMQGAE